jgi:NAD(P)-dependent dehydrogenase (short-subunit alcohol dehydrogenase family)
MKELGGKTAVVTGAASGIGKALAEKLLAEGMRVVLADRDEPALARAAESMSTRGEVVAVPTDVTSGAAVDALAAAAKRAFGDVHLLCNNAGVGGVAGLLWTLSENDWTWTLSVNLWGVIHGIRAFVPSMIAHGADAHVVNTASIAGLAAPTFMGPYVASKHAVVSLSEVLARDLEAFGSKVRVSVLCPGFVRTQIHESERHRPAHLANPSFAASADPARAMMAGAMKQLVEGGKDPEEIADRVVEAVRAGRFYVLPHEDLKGLVRERMTDVLEDGYPRFDPDQFLPRKNRR